MRAEILMIGTELLIGQIQDSNATFLAQVLAENGINLYQKTTVGDNRERIVDALKGALERSDVVLCSGGLGPTEDDITRECVAEVFGQKLSFRQELWDEVMARFAHVQIKITENNKKQAMLPEQGIVLENPRGTAPGLLMEGEQGAVICMPGVPHELKAMMNTHVIPYLRDKAGIPGVLHYRVLKVCGVGESRIDDMMGDLINAHDNPTIGLLANPEATRIRIAARAESLEEAEALIEPVVTAIEKRLPGMIMGQDEDTLEGVVDALLLENGWTLALYEETTGGMIAQRLVAAGARSFVGGKVGVSAICQSDKVEDHGLDLATGIMGEYGSTCGLSVVRDADNKQSVGTLITPNGNFKWIVGEFGGGIRNQTRASVFGLDHLRKVLRGVITS